MLLRLYFALAGVALLLPAADSYRGPRPPKQDVPYLLHADRIVEMEGAEAREEKKKNDVTYVIDGASSPAKTPLAEPIFIIDTKNLTADRIELYKLEVRNGHREVTLNGRRAKGGPKPLHLLVTRLADHLFRIEADEHLDNGEYSLSSNDSNRVFCFQVY
jgi:hypothetical protein